MRNYSFVAYLVEDERPEESLPQPDIVEDLDQEDIPSYDDSLDQEMKNAAGNIDQANDNKIIVVPNDEIEDDERDARSLIVKKDPRELI